MKKRLIVAGCALCMTTALTACAPDDPEQDREPVSTTSRIGGFIIEDEAPGYDQEWSSLAEDPELDE